MSNVSAWVAAVASAISAWAAWQMWRVSRSMLKLQSSIENSKKASVQIWINPSKDDKVGYFTIVNVGGTTLPVRSLRVIGNGGQAVSFSIELRDDGVRIVDARTAMMEALASRTQQKFDLLLEPNVVYRAKFSLDTTQPKIEVMYYDNSFEFLPLDTSRLGPYTLIGQGRT
ncbi:MAG TPA: hypothetical protein VJB59_01220 [Bdellovibrionota bacterium]|nr:hypothetical protein [Bdellovibrionota bacterium]